LLNLRRLSVTSRMLLYYRKRKKAGFRCRLHIQSNASLFTAYRDSPEVFVQPHVVQPT
jgi:hypothetical protein